MMNAYIADQLMRVMAQREQMLWDFAASGAFMNEITQRFQPETGKWWIE